MTLTRRRRSHPSRVRRGAGRVRRRALALALRGEGVECPCCGAHLRRFVEFNGRRGALCPACGSLERHRALWLLLRERWGGGSRPERVLHFAPEGALTRNLRELGFEQYLTADLEADADLTLDICDTGLPGASFDGIICSHVLEHVSDDRRAMQELLRLLRPGGEVIVMVPLDPSRERTDEAPELTDPAERERRFGQDDHLRLYGRDFEARLVEAGFDVSAERAPASEAERQRLGLRASDLIFVSRRTA